MEISRRFKVLMVAVAAFVMSAAPAYSWAHYDGSGLPNRAYHQGYYYDGYGRLHRQAPWGVGSSRWYSHRVYDPAVRTAVPFGFYIPGLSIYVGW